MKNFFQRSRPDSQPKASNEAYKVWLPRPEAAPRTNTAPAAPSTWAPSSGPTSARRGNSAPSAEPSASTSQAYKYAAAPTSSNNYYPAQPIQLQPQYYQPPLQRPDSRLGYVPYPYQNPQYPQTFAPAPASSVVPTTQRREDTTRNVAEAPRHSSRKQSEKEEPSRSRREASSSRVDVEVKKSKQKTREPSETKKKKDSRVGEPPADKYREHSSRSEAKREAKRRPDLRVDEGDSSDSSLQRPAPRTGHRRRDDKTSLMTSRPQAERVSSRIGVPLQPTTASSSSGKQTPQISRMPVYLPATQTKPRRPDDGQLGLSESDTDHGTHNRGRNLLGTIPLSASKQPPRPATAQPIPVKKKESKGLWPFSRSRSSQKVAASVPVAPPNNATTPSRKTRAESTPPRLSPAPGPSAPAARPEYRRHASDSTIGARPVQSVPPQPRPPDVEPPNSRTSAFAAPDSMGETSRPLTSASQQAALHSLRLRNNDVPQSFIAQTNPASATASYPQQPATSLHGPIPGVPLAPGSTQHPETPLRRDGPSLPPIYAQPAPSRSTVPDRLTTPKPDGFTMPPIYAQPVLSRPTVPERSTTPKVSQLVAGFEARDTAAHVPQQTTKHPTTTAKRDARSHAAPHVSDASTSAPSSGPTNPHVIASQPPPTLKPPPPLNAFSDHRARPQPELSNVQPRPTKQSDPLTTQLRDLLADKPAASTSRSAERAKPPEPNHPSKSHHAPPAPAPPGLHSTSKPPDLNSSQTFAFPQPPVQVYSATTSLPPPKSSAKTNKSVENLPHHNPAPPSSSRRPENSHLYSTERTSRAGRSGEDPRDGRSSRSKKDHVAVMKTPSKDSSRYTSSPVLPSGSTNPPRSTDKASHGQSGTSRSQPPIAYAESSSRHATNTATSSTVPGDRTFSKDSQARPTVPGRAPSNEHSTTTPHTAPTHSFNQSDRARPTPTTSTPLQPVSQLSVPPPLRPPSRTANVSSSQTLSSETSNPSGLSSSRPSGQPSVPPPLRPPSRAANVSSSQTPSSETSNPSGLSSSRPSGSSNSRAVPRKASEESILKTPSSLAHSVLPPLQPTTSRTSIPASVASETRKKGLLGGVFRSKAAQQSEEILYPTSSTKTRDRGYRSGSEDVDQPPESSDRHRRTRQQVPPPIAIPNATVPISERKSPSSRVFTPFRILSNKRRRRVSTASLDAVNGTAPNTVMGSPTASMQSSQMPPAQAPPHRDPMVAAQDWRNQEESQLTARGKVRRRRPGVVFDVAEDPHEETRRSRVTRLKKSQPEDSGDLTTTDSSDG